MCLLNGDIGGVIESLTADFGKYDQIDNKGNLLRRDYQIKEIIKEAVHHYGKEPYSNIVIKDLDMAGLELLEYRGDKSLFLLIQDDMVTGYRFAGAGNETAETGYRKFDPITKEVGETISIEDEDFVYDNRISITFGEEENNPTYIVAEDDLDHPYTVAKINFGDSCGYRETELTYVGDLIGNVGESITQAVLDKIVSMLGNYEYFYDVDGRFIFREKQNYINNSWNSIKDNGDSLFVENAAYASPVSYSFLDNNLITSFQNTPNLLNLKNDYSIWGEKTIGDNQYPIHLRYAIDEKPKYYKNFKEEIYLTQDEYDKLRFLGQLEDDSKVVIIITSRSRFKITPLPQGLSDSWWEIDDWTRRYLYFADVNDDQGRTIEDYINLTSYEVKEIVDASTRPLDQTVHDFNYYVYQLKINQLGRFVKEWATEDWLGIFPEPDQGYTSYYSAIKRAANQGLNYWAWLFDTALDANGNEYIRSVEHGYNTLPEGQYPSASPGCTHVFSYALDRKNGGGFFKSYIYDPQVPDSLKVDAEFTEKEDTTSEDITLYDARYHICDWREIIYQMAYDYFHYQHNDNYNAIIALNNKEYYPDGFTKYEQYYTDIYGFWRDIYNPKADGLTSHIVDLSLQNLYSWNKEEKKFEPIDLQDPNNVYISDPKDVVNEDGAFYYVSGKDKYSPYVVGQMNGDYFSQGLYKNLSNLRTDKKYRAVQITWNSSNSFNQSKQNYILQNSNYIPIYEPIEGINTYYTQTASDYINWNQTGYRKISLTRSEWVKDKYYLFNGINYTLDSSEVFDSNNVYYELSPKFVLGYKYYLDESWRKTINFAAGVNYYTQNYYQLITNSSEAQSWDYYGITNDGEAVWQEAYNNNYYKKVSDYSQNVTIAYELEKNIDPNIQYFDFLSTTSFDLYSKVEAFVKGQRYYYEYLKPNAGLGEDYFGLEAANAWSSVYCYGLMDGEIILFKQNPGLETTYYRIIPYTSGTRYSKQYRVASAVYFDNNTTYYIKSSASDQEVCDLSSVVKNGTYFYTEENEQSYISAAAAPDKSCIMAGNSAAFYPGDIYYYYYKQDYNNMDNGYYYMMGDYYYLSEDETFYNDLTYYYDTYGTVAPITREQYKANIYYYKDFFSRLMFTKYNILIRFKKGFSYYAIENNTNTSLLSNKNYLYATFYPKASTIFYKMNDSGILEKVGNVTQEDFYNDDYYIAYGEYNYYNYADFILNNLVASYANEYNKDAIYYKEIEGNVVVDKYHCIGKIAEDEFVSQTLYTASSALTFKKSSTRPAAETLPQTYYLFPTLTSGMEITDPEDWDENLFELLNDGIYLENKFNPETYWNFDVQNPENLIFWFDFLDVSTGGDLAQYSAHLVGNRPKTINSKDVKSIYYRDIPSVIFQDSQSGYVKIFINEEIFAAREEEYYIYNNNTNSFEQVKSFSKNENHYILKNGTLVEVRSRDLYYDDIDMYTEDGVLTQKYSAGTDYYRKWNAIQDMNSGYTYVNLTDNISNLFTVSSQKKSTFNVLDEFLYNNSYCTESITLQAIPVYYLEPNNRILVRDDSTGINGEYLVQRISYQLNHSGTMSITATKAVSRIY